MKTEIIKLVSKLHCLLHLELSLLIAEFLGRVVIPLLRIRSGEKRWYALKDKNLTTRAKGVSPQIQLEMTVVWNPIKAAFRVLEPKEEKLVTQEAKFKRQLFLRNVTRLKEIIMFFIDVGQFIQ